MRALPSLVVAVLCLSTAAFAVRPGDTLYVVGADVKLLKDPRRTAAAAATLQRGEPVTWHGVAEKDAAFVMVEAKGKKGFVPRGALTPFKPQPEPVVPAATAPPSFAASGAETKDSPREDPAKKKAADELAAVEKLNRERVGPAELAAKEKELSGAR